MKNLKPFFLSFVDYQLLIQRILMLLQLLVFVLGLLFGKNFSLISLILIFCSVMYAMFTFCLVDLEKAKKQFNIAAWAVSFSVCELMNGTLFTNFKSFPKVLLILFDVMIIMMIIILAHPSKEDKDFNRRKAIEDLLTRNIYSGDDLGDMDTYMGIRVEDGKVNVIPYKDRFLHALVLGVTGCGKTSQSLVPMVFKDIKCKELGVVCLDPKGDFAEQVYAMAKIAGRDDAVYFNPTLSNCPFFNPMMGDLDSVSECLVTTFKKLENEQQTFFANMDEMLMRRCIKVAKRLYDDDPTQDATLNHINILMTNAAGEGKVMLNQLAHKSFSDILVEQENNEIISWFLTDYYTGLGGGRTQTKTYEQCSGVRNQVSKLLANSLIKKILCPTKPKTEMEYDEYLDFDRVLKDGGVLALSSAQGELRELGSFIGYFLILSFESAVFRRPGDENTRKGVIFYVDEFQKYANDGYNDLLTMGRSYRVASVLATQTRDGIAANSTAAEGKVLIDVVSSNCRNKIVYPGGSYEDAKYYSQQFGEFKEIKEKTSYSMKRGLFSRYDLSTQSESHSTDEKMTPRFNPTEIMQRPFGEAIAQVVRNNTVQEPCVVKLKFIPKEDKKKIDAFIESEIRPMHINFKSEEVDFDEEGKRRAISMINDYEIEPLPEGPGDFDDEFQGIQR